jgi:hypothetical protein
MKKMAKILLIGLGFGVATAVLGFLTSKPAPAQLPPPTVPVVVRNTPLPVQGTVNASQNGAWNVGVNNFPTTQTVSFSGVQPVSFSNTPFSPVFTRDVDNGRNPFQVRLVLDNTNPGALPGCNIAQCQANFDVPTGKRLVIEQVSAKIQGAPGQKYMAFLDGATAATDQPFFAWLELNFQGSFLNNNVDVYTANQPVRAYYEENQPPPLVIVESNNAGSFFAEINIAGYLVPSQ